MLYIPPTIGESRCKHETGGGNDHCCCTRTSCISFFCFFWHMNPLHWRNTLWNWSISMTANRSYRGLQLLPVQLYPIGIVWFCTPTGTISLWFSVKYYPDRVYIFIVVYLLYIPTGFYRQPDWDYFYTLYIYIYPDRVYCSRCAYHMMGDQL